MAVRLRDGIEIELETGKLVGADASVPAGDINIVSHAHGDHLPTTSPGGVLCSEVTADLAGVRREIRMTPQEHPAVTLLPSGHVAGSRAAVIEDGETRYLYTGDVSTRDRFYLDGFRPVDADVVIIESTYGKPLYEFPDQQTVEARIVEWLDETNERPVVLFGYALGRAQELELLVKRADRGTVYVTDTIHEINHVVADWYDVSFDVALYDRDTTLHEDDVLVLPSQTRSLDFVEAIVDEAGALTAGFTGWAVDESYRYRTGLDIGFPLSDHCDYGELLDLVRAVNPRKVYTHHGFASALARNIQSELRISARAMQSNQSTLDEF